MLLDGIKFDLRVYIVVVGIDPIQAFVCNEGLARFCTVKYEQPKKENNKKAFMHLTNYSINKTSNDYVKPAQVEGDILEDNEGTKRTLSSLFDTLDKQKVADSQTIKANIADACARVMQVYAPMIEH